MYEDILGSHNQTVTRYTGGARQRQSQEDPFLEDKNEMEGKASHNTSDLCFTCLCVCVCVCK